METRIAMIGIILENQQRAKEVNAVLSDFADCIVGRMGLPQVDDHLFVISLVVKASQERISSLSGKLGMIPQVSSKTLYAKQKIHHA